jgi:hypothetical protein
VSWTAEDLQAYLALELISGGEGLRKVVHTTTCEAFCSSL